MTGDQHRAAHGAAGSPAGAGERGESDVIDVLAGRVVSVLKRARLATGREDDTQADIARALAATGIHFQRERRLTLSDRPDFLVEGGLVIEVKLRAPKAAIYRQLERYARHDATRGILLVSATAMGLPPAIEGKPAYLLSVGSTWL